MSHRTLNLDEAANYLHIGRAAVEELVRTRDIPHQRQGDRLVFRKKEIDEWASQRILGLKGKPLEAYHKGTSAKVHDLSKQHAIMPELIKPAYIEPALTSKTRSSVIRDMVKIADQTGLVCNAKELQESIEGRERLCPTALAGGIALLHPKSQEPYMFEDSFIVLGRAIQPVPFGSPDGATTDLFFLVCCQDDRIHLHVLARLCMLCHHTSVLLELRDAPDAAAIYDALVAAENEVIQTL